MRIGLLPATSFLLAIHAASPVTSAQAQAIEQICATGMSVCLRGTGVPDVHRGTTLTLKVQSQLIDHTSQSQVSSSVPGTVHPTIVGNGYPCNGSGCLDIAVKVDPTHPIAMSTVVLFIGGRPLPIRVLRRGELDVTSFTVTPNNAAFGTPVTVDVRGADLDNARVQTDGSVTMNVQMLANTTTHLRFLATLTGGAPTPTVMLRISDSRFPYDRPAGNAYTFFTGGLPTGYDNGPKILFNVAGPAFVAPGGPPLGGGRGANPPPPPAAAALTDVAVVNGGFLLRHTNPFRQIDATFCNAVPPARDPFVPALGQVTIPPVTVSVVLNSNNPLATNFSVRVLAGAQQVADQQVAGLSAGGTKTITLTARTESRTNALRIIPTTSATSRRPYGGPNAIGCFQQVMLPNNPFNWVDPIYTVQIRDPAGVVVSTKTF